MKNWFQHSLIVFLFLFLPEIVPAQDVSFSQFYSNPIYLNPAFSGTLGVPRINLQYRQQWHSLVNAYVSQSLSIDFPVKILRGGVGVQFIKDSQADDILITKQFNAIYSAIINVGEDMQLSGAIQAGVNENSIEWDRLIFSDNLDPYFGNHGISSESVIADPKYRFFDFASGVILFNDYFFSGLALHHLSEPDYNWYNGNMNQNKIFRKYTLHSGSRIPVHFKGSWRKSFDAMPQIAFMKQGRFWQFNYGFLANLKGFTAGVWLRQDQRFDYESVILLAGYMKKRWHFTYSYDIAISGLAGHSGGTSEFSVGFLLKDFSKNLPFPFYSPYEDVLGR